MNEPDSQDRAEALQRDCISEQQKMIDYLLKREADGASVEAAIYGSLAAIGVQAGSCIETRLETAHLIRLFVDSLMCGMNQASRGHDHRAEH